MGCRQWHIDDATEYLIQGGTGGKASRPSCVSDIVSKTLTHFNSLYLERRYQTASWKRVLGHKMATGTYIIFFIVTSQRGDPLYKELRVNGGKYLQMAIYATLRLSYFPHATLKAQHSY